MLTLSTFEEAAKKVKEVTQETKLIYSPNFSKETGNEVYLKPENMQRTGAYKVRGAYYKISTLTDEERQRGLITASAGNHAQGVAYAASKYGVNATIVMPTTTPLIKVERTKELGAEVILAGRIVRPCDEGCRRARPYVHPSVQRPHRRCRPGLHRHGDRARASFGRRDPGAHRRRRTRNGRFHVGEDAEPPHQGYRRRA